MSSANKRDKVRQDMENPTYVERLTNKVRKNVMARYGKWATDLGLYFDKFEVIAGCSAAGGIAKAFQQLERWDPAQAGFTTWSTMKANKIAERAMKKLDRECVQILPTDDRLFDPAMDHSVWDRVETREDVAEILNGLKPEHAEILRLRIYQQHPYRDIALRMNRSEQATRALFQRAVQAAARIEATLVVLPERDNRGPPPRARTNVINLASHKEHKEEKRAKN